MAEISTIINGSASQAGYEYYLNVVVNDTMNSDNTFSVRVDAYIVNHGSRTNTNGWTKNTRIEGNNEYTDTNQNLNTTNVDRYGGVTLAIRHYYRIPISMSQIYVSSYMSKSSYASYDPGYCSASAWVSMPKVQSTWASSLLSIPDITQSFTLPINKYVDEYYNVVEVRNQDNTILVKTINNAINGTSVTFTTNEINTITTMDVNQYYPNQRFYMDLKTYTNSSKTTQIGTAQRLTCDAYLPNPNPTATINVEEQDEGVISFLGSSTSSKIVKNASDLLFTINQSLKYSAYVRSIKINGADATYDSVNRNYTYNTSNITTGTFEVVIKDTRGYITTYTITKTLLDYISVKIDTNWTIERITPISSDFKLNASIDCWSSTIDGTTNTPTIQYSTDNENWSTISSSSYTFSDNKITISNLTISNLMSYQNYGTFYLKCTDLVSSSQDNKPISKGIETFSYGENDLQVNGDLYVADEDGNNKANILKPYSSSEKVVGYWTDGKPIFRKVVDLGSMPNATTKNVAHSISNLDKVIAIRGMCTNGTTTFPLPYAMALTYATNEYDFSIYVNATNIVIATGTNRSSYSGFAIIDYTKTS